MKNKKKKNAYLVGDFYECTVKLRRTEPIVFMLLCEWLSSIQLSIEVGADSHISFITKSSNSNFITFQFFNTSNLPNGIDLDCLVNYINNNS